MQLPDGECDRWLSRVALFVCLASLILEIASLLVGFPSLMRRVVGYSSTVIAVLFLWQIKRRWGRIRPPTSVRRSLRLLVCAAEVQWWAGLASTVLWNQVTGSGLSSHASSGTGKVLNAADYAMTMGFSFWMSLTYLVMRADSKKGGEKPPVDLAV